jgi:head-tail adaptor
MARKPSVNRLSDRVRFDRRALDANGDRLGAWTPAFSCWAEVIFLRGSEAVVSLRLEGKKPAAFVIRASAAARAIDPSYRVVMLNGDGTDGQRYNVTSAAENNEDDAFIDVLAVSGTAEG